MMKSKRNLRRARVFTLSPMLIVVVLLLIALVFNGCASTTSPYNYRADPAVKLQDMVQAFQQNPLNPPFTLEQMVGYAKFNRIAFDPKPLIQMRQQQGFAEIQKQRQRFYQTGIFLDPQLVLEDVREIELEYGFFPQAEKNFAVDVYERHKLNVAFMINQLREKPDSEVFSPDEIRTYAKANLRYADWPKSAVLDDIGKRYHQNVLTNMFAELRQSPGTSSVTAADIRAYANQNGIKYDMAELARIQRAHEQALSGAVVFSRLPKK